ncbi:uncharacterized protein EAF01_003917 [Botrytis porri]|uniref:Uncharacterized protein n=1 Tax=Botrytis porri TaxID=87229 RepID=A0A4Z1K9V6_9HELO|nr:uncharacterized protein EAF01_003917 [Botrytis porri]KAF7908162.1 hypothetical protein EAF01_003917 [Botrytis porri]TGO82787.1 hypothetical protein BPOR_0759g00030 [Botrytis porri]
MRTNSSGLREQNGAKRERQRDEPRGSGLRYIEKPKYTSARDPKLVLAQPQPDWNRYTVAKIPQKFERMNSEVRGENEADGQSGANEHSAAASPKNHSNGRIPRKPVSKEPAKKSDLTLSQIEYEIFLAAGANPSSRPPPEATIPSQSRSKQHIPNPTPHKSRPHIPRQSQTNDLPSGQRRMGRVDIPRMSSSYHGAESGLGSDSSNSRPPNRRRTRAEDERTNSTRGQNKEIIIPKTRENPALPPRNMHKQDQLSTPQQYPRLSGHRAVAREHHCPITADLQESRQLPDSVPRSHTNQRNGSQIPANYSYPSHRVRP